MKKKVSTLGILLVLLPISSIGMDFSSQQEEISEVVKELTQEMQPKFRRMAALMTHPPFGKQVSKEEFDTLKRLARPQYCFLLEKLLDKEILDANTYCEDKGKKFSLLGEAVDYLARESERNNSKYDSRVVQLLLKKNAETNHELDFSKTEIQKRTTCLIRAIEVGSMSLLGHLLTAGADPNKVDESGRLPLNVSMKLHITSGRREFFNIACELVSSGAKPITQVNENDFNLVKQLVYPKFFSLFKCLLQQKILDAQAYCQQRTGRVTLMDEAIRAITPVLFNYSTLVSESDRNNHDDIRVVQLMMARGVVPKKESYLNSACSAGAQKLVDLLLGCGVIPDCPGRLLQPLYMPTVNYIYNGESNNLDIITSLLLAGAKPHGRSFEGTRNQSSTEFAQEHIRYVDHSEQQETLTDSKKRAEALLGIFARCDVKK